MPRLVKNRPHAPAIRVLRRISILSASAAVIAASGCGSLMTTAAINRFQDHLEAGDIEGLATATTERFRTAAIPDPAALSTFDLLGVPVGDVTIDEVKETSPTTRDVDVSVEGSSRKLTYHLSKEADSIGRTRWLIDEISIRQGTSSKTVEKTVSEQMALLLGVREVVRAWQKADPNEIALHASPRLAETLEQLPPNWRTQLAKHYFADVMNSKPRARMIDGEAEVTLSHKDGQLRLILEEADGTADIDAPKGGRGWVVKTAVIVGRGKEITRELRREADLAATTSQFVTAYAGNDQSTLERHSTAPLYENVLAVADLTQSPLNPSAIFSLPYEAQFSDVSSELIVNIDGSETHFTLTSAEKGSHTDLKIDDISVFKDGQTIRLSAKLLVIPTVTMFNQALNAGDVPRLKYLTASDWKNVVWDRFQEDRQNVLRTIALPEFRMDSSNPDELPVIRHNGASVEVRQITGDVIVSYRLVSSSQRLVIDDVELIDLHGVTRLQSRLTALCTLDQLADGIITGDLDAIAAASTSELNRLVWAISSPEELPGTLDLVPILKGRVHALETQGEETVVTVAEDYPMARIVLSADGTQIDDVIFLDRAGVETGRFAQLVRKHRIHTRNR